MRNPNLLTLLLAFSFATPAFAGSCAQFHLQNESFDTAKGAETECRSLGLGFDLNACADSKSVAPASIRCDGENATASIRTRAAKYEISLKRYLGSKGNALWDTEGAIRETALEEHHEHEKKKKRKTKSLTASASHPSADRQPAEVRNLNEKTQTAAAQQTAPAEKPAAPAPAPSPSAAPEAAAAPAIPPTLSISGILDLYYAQNFNRPSPVSNPTLASPNLPAPQNQLRNFDLYSNQFALNFAELTVKNTEKEVGFLVDLDFGEQADYVARLGGGATDNVTKHLGQALLTYSPAQIPKLSFAVGKMYTNLGYETTKAINNWQYSRSFLFSEGLPYWHVGASATYNFAPGLFTATASVYNGWNSIYETNSGKTFALQLTLTPNDALTFTYNGISGPEQPADNSDLTQIHELIATWNASARTQFAWDSIFGWAGQGYAGLDAAHWAASSIAMKYQLNPWYSLSPRAEFYSDPNGYTTGTAQNLSSFTLTQAFKPTKGLEPRVELRWDHSSEASFQANTGPTKNQVTLAFAILYGF